MQAYFDQLDQMSLVDPETAKSLAFRHYNPDEIILGKRMGEQLRFAACYWHNFCWNGADMFGAGSFERPWQQLGENDRRTGAKTAKDYSETSSTLTFSTKKPCFPVANSRQKTPGTKTKKPAIKRA